MVKRELFEKIKHMLNELGWPDEVITDYCRENFGGIEETTTAEIQAK